MGAKRGLDKKLYYNAATWASPTWTLVNNVRDFTTGDKKDEGDASNRSQTTKMTLGTLKDVQLTWQMVDDPADTALIAFQAAYDASPGTLIEFAVANGPIATVGTKYRRWECEIFDLSAEDALDGVSYINVLAKPTYTANAQGGRTTA